MLSGMAEKTQSMLIDRDVGNIFSDLTKLLCVMVPARITQLSGEKDRMTELLFTVIIIINTMI